MVDDIRSDLTWRQLQAFDLTQVNKVADAVHTLYERDEVLSEKFSLYPQGCFALVRDDTVVGYGLSHPYHFLQIPPLDSFLDALPSEADCLYVHDVAVLPEARGNGATQLLHRLLVEVSRAHQLDRIALVSVYGTTPFWSRLGFVEVIGGSLDEKLKSYGPSARYMAQDIIDFSSECGINSQCVTMS